MAKCLTCQPFNFVTWFQTLDASHEIDLSRIVRVGSGIYHI